MLNNQEREELRLRWEAVGEELSCIEQLALQNLKDHRRFGEALVDYSKSEPGLLAELQRIEGTLEADTLERLKELLTPLLQGPEAEAVHRELVRLTAASTHALLRNVKGSEP